MKMYVLCTLIFLVLAHVLLDIVEEEELITILPLLL